MVAAAVVGDDGGGVVVDVVAAVDGGGDEAGGCCYCHKGARLGGMPGTGRDYPLAFLRNWEYYSLAFFFFVLSFWILSLT